jgi:hypothetical protein
MNTQIKCALNGVALAAMLATAAGSLQAQTRDTRAAAPCAAWPPPAAPPARS